MKSIPSAPSRSTLRCAECQARDEVALHQEEHEHRRQGGEQRGRRDQLPLADELSVEGAHTGGDRQAVIALDQYGGPEEVVPDEGEDQHGQGCHRGPHQRQHQIPEDLEFADALDPRAFHQLVGQGLDEIAHEQRAEPGLEGA
jgi:hypothetical protein